MKIIITNAVQILSSESENKTLENPATITVNEDNVALQHIRQENDVFFDYDPDNIRLFVDFKFHFNRNINMDFMVRNTELRFSKKCSNTSRLLDLEDNDDVFEEVADFSKLNKKLKIKRINAKEPVKKNGQETCVEFRFEVSLPNGMGASSSVTEEAIKSLENFLKIDRNVFQFVGILKIREKNSGKDILTFELKTEPFTLSKNSEAEKSSLVLEKMWNPISD
ncbi:hypothetical protein CDIK_0818 [Cucumispora dikerogammari]|nr:hypothetical protein CDIK_0818 [Cucumispora dikerogammari]